MAHAGRAPGWGWPDLESFLVDVIALDRPELVPALRKLDRAALVSLADAAVMDDER